MKKKELAARIASRTVPLIDKPTFEKGFLLGFNLAKELLLKRAILAPDVGLVVTAGEITLLGEKELDNDAKE